MANGNVNKYLDLEGLSEVAEHVNKKLRIVTTMPSTPEVNDIVLYNGATTTKYASGSIYSYQQVGTYYTWTDLTDTYYTKSATPTVGDTVYSDTSGTDSGYLIEAYDNTNNQVTINSLTYDRDTTGDTDDYDWVAKGNGTSVILNGENKTGEEASFYAPTSAGTRGQFLASNGENTSPQWASITGYSPTFLGDSLIFTFGVILEVEGNTIVFDLDN